MNRLDVSVVLNVHREALFLRPTLLSLDACAAEAKNAGIAAELVVVFDRSDDATRDVFRATILTGFSRVKTLEVDVGSLGPARNAGIDMAEGEFVWTADADDLVSRNSIVELAKTALQHPTRDVVVFMEYLVAFGEQFYVARYFGGDWLTAADFAFWHPCVSRIFVRRSAVASMRYRDLRVGTGFAYEDWDLNCRLFAEGFEFKIAENTLFFYRQRGNSLLRQANALSSRMIPHSPLFEPRRFRASMVGWRERNHDWRSLIARRQEIVDMNRAQELAASTQLAGYVVDAARLDPEVEPVRIASSHSYFPLPRDPKHWGFQLERLYELLGNEEFTDVVLLPWLRPGGAEKYILKVLEQLHASGEARRVLVLSGQAAPRHEWVQLLPPGSVFVDLFNFFPTLDETARTAMAARAMLAVSKAGGRLHLKACAFSHGMMDAYGAAIASHLRVIYYRFCDDSYVWGESRLSIPWGVKFLRGHLANIDLLICDCRKIAEIDAAVLGPQGRKYEVIYARCEVGPKRIGVERRPQRRLLWASRVSSQKRPELVAEIARALRRTHPDVVIEIRGEVDDNYAKEALFDAPGLEYRGGFHTFESLRIERFDALVYTSAFDGLPNMILEAMASGIPVIAPDVGGVSEAVASNETGYLVPNLMDDEALVAAYVSAIDAIYRDWNEALALAEEGRKLVAERHGAIEFAKRIAEVFGRREQALM